MIKIKSIIFLSLSLVGFSILNLNAQTDYKSPNVVIIYADDMGFGDLNCQNPNSKIPTPYLDNLASEGMRFTDAHSSSGICSPSRFSLLTGTYHWRRQHKIIGAFGTPDFFRAGDLTLPQMLKDMGYTTAAIGKWHLGWGWDAVREPNVPVQKVPKTWNNGTKVIIDVHTPDAFDWSKPVPNGPTTHGFDYYFGDGTINFPPYCFIENDRILEAPLAMMDESTFDEIGEGEWEFREGPMVEGWNPYDVLPTLTKKTVEWIGKQKQDKPFFLYFALPSPHAPIIPNKEFIGMSEAGAYGDFVVQSDWVAGQVLKALKNNGFEENTIVIFTADNGPEKYAFDRAVNFGHFSMGDFRGLKRDVWEGGHHVPFIIKWPNNIKQGSVSDEVISQVDIMATLAKINKKDLPEKAAPDSYNFLPVLKGEKHLTPLREATVHNTYEDKWGLRQGKWLYINNKNGGHSGMTESFRNLRGYENFNTKGLLFDMEKDAGQRINLYQKYPKKVKKMDALLMKYREQGYSVQR